VGIAEKVFKVTEINVETKMQFKAQALKIISTARRRG